MKRKSLLLLVAAVSLTALVGFGTNAEFSDTENSGNQSFAAGTLDMTVGGTAQTTPINVSNLAPGGAVASTTIDVVNAGSVAGALLSVDLVEVDASDLENGCGEPESGADGDTALDPGEAACAADTNGELDDNLTVTIKDGATTLFSGTLSAMDTAAATAIAGGLGADGSATDTKTLTIEWSVPTSAGNDIQSDGAGFALTFRLEQFV